MAGLDLSGVARVLDDWIVDEVEITLDNTAADDVLDPVTGQLTPPPPRVLYAGRGAVLPQNRNPSVPDPDAQVIAQETRGQHRLMLPSSVVAPAVRAGDKVRVTAANGTTPDPHLTRRRFEVVDLGEVSSFRLGTIVPLRQIGMVD